MKNLIRIIGFILLACSITQSIYLGVKHPQMRIVVVISLLLLSATILVMKRRKKYLNK